MTTQPIDYSTQTCVANADADQLVFPTRPVGSTSEVCPLIKQIVLIPRKPANIFDPEKYVKPLLPDRYPPKQAPLKKIELNFYPDMNQTRTVTAVVTDTSWTPQSERRTTPAAGIKVTFYRGPGTTADISLSASEATSDAEGCAAINVTVKTLETTKARIEATAGIEIIAVLPAEYGGGRATLTLTIHRNEDVDAALAPDECPDDFATTLAPVLNLQTWVVRQPKKYVTSNGARAVQQLLNQVACRYQGGGHEFLRPDGQFGSGSGSETGRFIRDFSREPVAGVQPIDTFTQRRFRVAVEEMPISPNQGVGTYVKAEYGSYTDGCLIDAYILVGPERWQRGSNVTAADGLLDLYTAVVWEFIETMYLRGREYADLGTNWYRHPNDNGPAANPWPASVTEGVAYWYGGARRLEDFVADLTVNSADLPNQTWFQYLRQNNSRIGLHGDGDTINVPTVTYQQYAHLNTDADIVNIAPPNAPPVYRLRHPYIDRVKRQYTGIDCSAFCQRAAMEARFRADHCADLAGEQICRLLPNITHNNGLAVSRLATGTWPPHYRAMPAQRWRPEIAFRGDVLNVTGSHIVVLATNNRDQLTGGQAGNIWIVHANGITTVAGTAAPHWPQNECVRRVVYSPLAEWATGWNSWGQATANVQYGRIYLWA